MHLWPGSAENPLEEATCAAVRTAAGRPVTWTLAAQGLPGQRPREGSKQLEQQDSRASVLWQRALLVFQRQSFG